MEERVNVSEFGVVHMIGIGGQGMAPIAEMLVAMGLEVRGSDAKDSARMQRLRAAGIDARAGHDPDRVNGADTVVISRAVRETNPELARARELGLPVWQRSDVLAGLSDTRRLVAVAGTHGKTTTSGMLAVLLSRAGLDPSFIVGSEIQELDTGAHLGRGTVMVAEADESDASFLKYRPEIAVITSLEPDHLDFYQTREAFEASFDRFCDQLVAGGAIVAFGDDPATAELARRRRAAGQRVVTYGTQPGADVVVSRSQEKGMLGQVVTLTLADGSAVTYHLTVPGTHNALDSAAAVVAALDLGVSPQEAARAIAEFRGTHRRFDLQGSVGGVEVYDDFGHHPTEIAAMLTMAREYVGSGRVHVLFQPYLYSRTRIFAREFAEALAIADDVMLCDILGAREDPEPGVTSQLVVDQAPAGREFRFVPDRFDAARAIARDAEAGDIIVTTGCGNMIEVAPTILSALAER